MHVFILWLIAEVIWRIHLKIPLYHSKVLSLKFLMEDMASDRAARKNGIDVSISNRLG